MRCGRLHGVFDMIKCSNGHATRMYKQYTGGYYYAEEFECPVCGERIMTYETGDGYISRPALWKKEGQCREDSISD